MRKPKKIAPKRFKFYSEKDYSYELSLSREFSDADAIAVIVLYRINIVKTKSHALYGESKVNQKKFLEPIELNITMEIESPETVYRQSGGMYNEMINKISFGVYKDELDNKKCVINRGDFFTYFDGEKERAFEITKVSNIDTNNSTLGYKPFFKMIEAVMVLDDSFKI